MKSAFRIGILGIAFKAGTDDPRESSAYDLIKVLTKDNFELDLHDPKVFENFETDIPILHSISDLKHILSSVDGVVINTEWPEYYNLNWASILSQGNIKFVIDLRNITPSLNHPKLFRIGVNL